MEQVESKDGTTIAFDQLGQGPPIILVAGASCDRGIGGPVAEALGQSFTVLNFDRRGRGDSTDTPPYAVAREVEDIHVLIEAAGGSASLLGFSSGAALAAEAAANGLPVDRLIMWEPPFSTDPDGPRRAKMYSDRLNELLATDRRGDALAHFMKQVGLPDEMIDGIRQSPYWQVGLSMAPTLAYDAAIMGDSTVPAGRFGTITVPTLVLAGSASPEFLRQAAAQAAAAIPGAEVDVLEGQGHDVAAEAIAPVVSRFAAR